MIVLVPYCSHCSGWWDSLSHSVEAQRGWVPCPSHLVWQWRCPLCLCEVGACLGWLTIKWWLGSPKLRPGWASRISSCLRAPLWSLSSRCLITQKGPGPVLPAIRSIYSCGPRRQGSGRQLLGAREVGVVGGDSCHCRVQGVFSVPFPLALEVEVHRPGQRAEGRGRGRPTPEGQEHPGH